jgi:putative hydrolase of the HAD superfamily
MSPDTTNSIAPVKAVIFDYGEVLCHRPTAAQTAQLAAFFNIDINSLPVLWEKNRGAYDRGDLTPEVYWSLLAQDAGVQLSPDRLDEICKLDVEMWSSVNSSMVNWARTLAASGVKIGLLSNMHPHMVAHVREKFEWLQSFHHVTFSAEARLIKPDPAIYEHTLRGLGVTAPESLFLDDREINIQAARRLGIQAIRVQSLRQLRRELENMGFAILPADC